jgi:hypothetical protein
MLVPSNVVRMFARTSILVVTTGLFHGIFLLPIICRSFASNHLPVETNEKHPLIEPPKPNEKCDKTEEVQLQETPVCFQKIYLALINSKLGF